AGVPHQPAANDWRHSAPLVLIAEHPASKAAVHAAAFSFARRILGCAREARWEGNMAFWNRRKPIEAPAHAELKRTLSWPHLVALGVGAIVGAGIYALIGQGAGMAGPGVIVSFAVAGTVCACAALCYAELATMMPASGSAYTYTYSS